MSTSIDQKKIPIAELSSAQRDEAMNRFCILKPHLENSVSLTDVAKNAGVSLRTAERWLARYKKDGLAGLARKVRSDEGSHKISTEITKIVEGMALQKPRPSIVSIHRKICDIATKNKWRAPSYTTVQTIIGNLNPAMVTLSQDPIAFRNQYEMVHLRRADKPNSIWQADHTQLDILIVDTNGKSKRPWLTIVIDDYSRAVAGFYVFIGAPSALNTSLAIRQAIWRKGGADWPVWGIPDALYVDHGSDFTSSHLTQVAADLRIKLFYSTVGRPQGRGKVERLFGTLNTELLTELPGNLINGKQSTNQKLSLSELDAAIQDYFVKTYNNRIHKEIGQSPLAAWLGDGWLPRMPDSLEELDLLLAMVAKSRVVHRDGIHFQGLRFIDPTLAPYVGESVTIRYDPRDITEIRVFHRNKFLCNAISQKHAGKTITLKDIQSARNHYRKSLKKKINERIVAVIDYLPENSSSRNSIPHPKQQRKKKPKLKTYYEDDSP